MTHLGLAVAVTLSLASCGDADARETEHPGVDTVDVEVIARDIAFDRHEYVTRSGGVSFRYENDGSIVHSLVIEDVDGFRLEVGTRGDEEVGAVELAAGEYVIFCDVAGHRAAGMEARLTVQE